MYDIYNTSIKKNTADNIPVYDQAEQTPMMMSATSQQHMKQMPFVQSDQPVLAQPQPVPSSVEGNRAPSQELNQQISYASNPYVESQATPVTNEPVIKSDKNPEEITHEYTDNQEGQDGQDDGQDDDDQDDGEQENSSHMQSPRNMAMASTDALQMAHTQGTTAFAQIQKRQEMADYPSRVATTKTAKRKNKKSKCQSPGKMQAMTQQDNISNSLAGGVGPNTGAMSVINSAQQVNMFNSNIMPNKNQINIVARKRPPPMPLKNFVVLGIDPKRKVLYRNFHDVEGTIYLVEISRNALKVFMLLFPNFEAPDIFIHEIIQEKKAQKLMLDSNNTFENLISKFRVVFGKLQILGYHGAALDPRRHKTVSPTGRLQISTFRGSACQSNNQQYVQKPANRLESLPNKYGHVSNHVSSLNMNESGANDNSDIRNQLKTKSSMEEGSVPHFGG
jgi:hypothetical protein